MGTKQLREVDRGALHDLATDSRAPKLCTNPIKDNLFLHLAEDFGKKVLCTRTPGSSARLVATLIYRDSRKASCEMLRSQVY